MKNKNIANYLKEFGFNETQSIVYVSILSHGRVLPAYIAKETGIRRPTVYAAITRLVESGLAHWDKAGTSAFVTANISDFEYFKKGIEEKLLLQKQAAAEITPLLQVISSSHNNIIPTIEYISEKDIEAFLYKQTPIWDKSMVTSNETTWWGHNSVDFTKHAFIQKWIEWYWPQAPKKIDLKFFSPTHTEEKKVAHAVQSVKRRNIKYWNQEQDVSLKIAGDYVILLNLSKHPYYCIHIHNRDIAESIRKTYRVMWNTL